MGRKRYFLVRSAQTIFMLWLVLTFLFFLFRLMPGSYSDLMLFRGASPEQVAAFRAKWGLDDPIYVQYVRYLGNALQLDFGHSLQTREPVIQFVKMKIFHSAILIVPAVLFSYSLGSALGTIMGMNRGSLLERYGIVPLIFLGSFPAFFTAIMLIIIFANGLNWFPTSGYISPGVSIEYADSAWWRIYFTESFAMHYVLPFTAVVFRYLYLPALIMRTSVVDILSEDFVDYFNITKLSKTKQRLNIGKHASLPVITLLPISLSRAIGGLVLIEVVFNWPGIGFELVNAVLRRDYAVVQFVFLLIAAFIIIGNFIVDIAYGVIDPRISISHRE
jgi:peptide/nickel transport system permease protein